MASVIGGNQRNTIQTSIQLVSQIGNQNVQEKQIQKDQALNNSFNNKANIDHLYDQNSETLGFQTGKSSIKITGSSRNNQTNVSDYLNYNMDNIVKQNPIKQNQSPWRRNLANQSNITGIGNRSKNGFYNNEQSTLSSLSGQRQQNYLIIPSNDKNICEQFKKSNNNSSYFLHVDQSIQSNQTDNPSISKYYHNYGNYNHRNQNGNGNFNSNPLNVLITQQNSIVISNVNELSQNNTSNVNKNKQRKNKLQNNQKSIGVEKSLRTAQISCESIPNIQKLKEKQYPLTERDSSLKLNSQKKSHLHSFNVNIHRIFKEDKSLNNQDNSDSSHSSNKAIGKRKEQFQTKTSKENINSNDFGTSNAYLNLHDLSPSVKKNTQNQKKEIQQKNQNLILDKFCKLQKTERYNNRQYVKSNNNESQNQQIERQKSKEINNRSIIENDVECIPNNNECFEQKQNQTEKKLIENINNLDEQSTFLIKKCSDKENGCKSQMKMHQTEPQRQIRYCSQGKRKKNYNDLLNQNISNQQIKTEVNQKNKIINKKILSQNNSPKNNYRLRSITQQSTTGIPSKIIMSEINPNDSSIKQNKNDILVYMKTDNQQNESQQNIKYVKNNCSEFINYSSNLQCIDQTNQHYENIQGKDNTNSTIKNYINNSHMIKKTYRDIYNQIQQKQCRTQVDSQISLQNQTEVNQYSPRQNYTDQDALSIQLLSINQGDLRQSNLDDGNTIKEAHYRFSGNLYDRQQAKGSVPFIKQENYTVENEDSKYCDQRQNVKNKKYDNIFNHRKQLLPQQTYQKSINAQNNKAITSYKINDSSNNNNTHISQDKRQQRIRIRNKVYSMNSSNNSLNASILDKSHQYVEKYKFNHQNNLSLIQKMNKQKQIRENDLYNVSTSQGQPTIIHKKFEQFSDIDKKIQQLSHQKIEPQDLKSNHIKPNYQNNFQLKNQQSQNLHFRNYQSQSNSCQSNPYSPNQSRGNSYNTDYNNMHTSLSHNIQNDFSNMNDRQLTANLIKCLSNQKNELINSSQSNRENDNSCVSEIWRKLAYTKDQNKINQSSLEEELQKVDILSKKNEQALNQYVQIKDNAVQMSQYMSQINIRKQEIKLQGNI